MHQLPMLKKRRILWTALIAFLVIIILFVANKAVGIKGKDAPQAQNGVIDLSSWDFQEDGNVKLDGKWHFYWEQLLTYRDFQTNQTDHLRKADVSTEVNVPGVWNGSIVSGERLPGEGYATYRLHVKRKSQEDGLLGLRHFL